MFDSNSQTFANFQLQNLRHELALLLSRPLVAVVLIGAASAYALLIGNLYRYETVQNIPVAVCDLDDSPLSRELVRAVIDADQYDYTITLNNEAAAIDLLKDGSISAALIIPCDFSKRFYLQQPIELAFFQDGSNVLQVSYALPPMQYVLAQFSAKYSLQSNIMNETTQLPLSPVILSQRTYGNPTQSYLEFYIYGVMLMAAQLGICVAFSLSLQDDLKHSHNFSLPLKALMYLCLSLFSVLAAMYLLSFLFQLPLRADLSQFLILCAAFLFCVENFAGIITLYIKTQTSLIQCMVFYTLPAFLLSGYIWADTAMIDIIHLFSMLLPVHYVLADFRSLALVGTAPNLFHHIVLLFIVGIILYGVIQFKIQRKFLFQS